DTGKSMLPPRPGPLQIRYTLPELSAPEQVHFRYRLAGLGDDWILADRQRTATFAHLPPGEYRFEAAAAEADGPWLPATASHNLGAKLLRARAARSAASAAVSASFTPITPPRGMPGTVTASRKAWPFESALTVSALPGRVESRASQPKAAECCSPRAMPPAS